MIELTEEQVEAVGAAEEGCLRLIDPHSNEAYVLLPAAEYERLKQADYDDSPWTSEERQALAWEAGKHAGWDDMDEYDQIPDQS